MQVAELARAHGKTDQARIRIELVSTRHLTMRRRETMSEPIAGEAWQDVEMNMKDLLPRCLAVRKEQIDPLRSHTRASNGGG